MPNIFSLSNIVTSVNLWNAASIFSNQTEILKSAQAFNFGAIPLFTTDISWFRIIISISQMISVIVAAVYYIFISRNTIKTRKAQLFMQFYNIYNSLEYQKNHFYIIGLEWEDFDDYWENYGPFSNPEANAIIAAEGGFFEGVGVLVKEKLIDITLVDELMAGNITHYWEKMGTVVDGIRSTLEWPQAMEWTEYLYEEIVKVQASQKKK